MNNRKFHCDNCGAGVTTDEAEVDGGLVIDLTGHYNGFNDDFGGFDEDDTSNLTILCHDCTLAVYRAIPKATEKWLGVAHFHANCNCTCEYGSTGAAEGA